MSYRIEMRNCAIALEDGFSGTVDIDDALITALDTTLLVDQATLDLHDAATVVPVGARMVFDAEADVIRTVTAQNANKQWEVTVDATSGNFTLTFLGQTTANIAYTTSLTAATVQTALENLSNVEVGDLIVSGANGGPFTVEARGQYLGSATPTLSATDVDLTGGGSTVDVATVQPGNRTWSLTFSPALTSGALPTDGDTITFLGQRVYIKVGDGNFEATENEEFTFDTDRGRLDGVRRGNETPMDLSTTFVFDFLRASSGQAITVYEALKRKGGASGWHNAAEDPCEPYCVNVIVIHRPPCGSAQAEVMTFPRFYATSRGININDAQISLQGQCNALEPVVEREDAAQFADLFED